MVDNFVSITNGVLEEKKPMYKQLSILVESFDIAFIKIDSVVFVGSNIHTLEIYNIKYTYSTYQ